MISRRAGVLVVLAVLVTTATGCKSSTTPQAGATSPRPASPGSSASPTATGTATPGSTPLLDPCNLLTTAQVSGVLGGTVGAPAPSMFLSYPICNIPVSATASPAGVVNVQILLPLSFSRAQFDTNKVLAGNTQVSGIGDGAYYGPSQAGLVFTEHTLFVEVVLQYSQSPLPSPTQQQMDALVALGKDAAARF